MNKAQELWEEIREVFQQRPLLTGSALPPLIFLLLVGFTGVWWAAGIAWATAVLLALFNWRRQQAIMPVVWGAVLVAVAALAAQVVGGETGFFLPTLLSRVGVVVVAVVSIIVGRPMVAWTSYLARRWPWQWYWHPLVRPAYSEVTWGWAVFFALRLLLQWVYFQRGDARTLAVVEVVTGWPATLLLLIATYLYGTWRLRRLGGPSVDEFKAGAERPWQSQRRGF